MKLKTVVSHMLLVVLAMFFLAANGTLADDSDGKIIHDGEFNFIKAQYGDKWAAEDKEIDAKLAEIRAKNGGK